MENCFNPNNSESMEYQLKTRKIAHQKGIGGESFIKKSLIRTAEKKGAPGVNEAKEWNERMVSIYGSAIEF